MVGAFRTAHFCFLGLIDFIGVTRNGPHRVVQFVLARKPVAMLDVPRAVLDSGSVLLSVIVRRHAVDPQPGEVGVLDFFPPVNSLPATAAAKPTVTPKMVADVSGPISLADARITVAGTARTNATYWLKRSPIPLFLCHRLKRPPTRRT